MWDTAAAVVIERGLLFPFKFTAERIGIDAVGADAVADATAAAAAAATAEATTVNALCPTGFAVTALA